MPTFYLIAGPNGAGKSTYFDWAVEQGRLPAIPQVNGDVLYKNKPALTQTEVAALVEQQLRDYCQEGVSFSMGSNLATSSSYSIVNFTKKRDYRVELLFITNESPQECGKRVQTRVSQGGHDVPYPVIEQR